MFRKFFLLFLAVLWAGCAVVPRMEDPRAVAQILDSPVMADKGEKAVEPLQSGRESKDLQKLTEQAGVQEEKLGLVFGRTDFLGLLKAAYVRLTVIPDGEPEQKKYFYIGSKENQSVLPWDAGKIIEPGYFYFELSPGKYRVIALAIPVASTVAEEDIALDFEVAEDKVFYLGTLEVNGTREKVKFGGVPVLRPGFEYEFAVRDDFEQAKKDFEALLPEHHAGIVKNLMAPGMITEESN